MDGEWNRIKIIDLRDKNNGPSDMIMGARIEQAHKMQWDGNEWNNGNEIRDQRSGPSNHRMDSKEA